MAEPKYDKLPKELLGNLFYKQCDAYNTQQIKETLEFANNKMGCINVLINAATFGAGYGEHATPDKMSDEEWRNNFV